SITCIKLEGCGKLSLLIFGAEKMFWIILGILLLFMFMLILLIHIKIKVHYYFNQEVHEMNVQMYIIRVRVFQRNINLKNHVQDEYSDLMEMLQDEGDGFNLNRLKQMVKNLLQGLKIAKQLLLFILQNITFQQIEWKTHFGTGEASSTGIVSGGIWMVKGTLLGALSEFSNLNCQPNIIIIPYFQQRGFQSKIDCIVTIRLGKAIHTAMYLLRKIFGNKEVYN
ncbi:DUF2953 domain-containing protein, partial [Ornithinibacillus bavariensis]